MEPQTNKQTNKQKKPPLNSQSNLEKEEQSWRYPTPGLETILQSYSYQNSKVLAQKQAHRSVQQNRESRNKPTLIWSINLHNRGKSIKWSKDSLMDSYMQKNQTGLLLYTVYKNKFKMD